MDSDDDELVVGWRGSNNEAVVAPLVSSCVEELKLDTPSVVVDLPRRNKKDEVIFETKKKKKMIKKKPLLLEESCPRKRAAAWKRSEGSVSSFKSFFRQSSAGLPRTKKRRTSTSKSGLREELSVVRAKRAAATKLACGEYPLDRRRIDDPRPAAYRDYTVFELVARGHRAICVCVDHATRQGAFVVVPDRVRRSLALAPPSALRIYQPLVLPLSPGRVASIVLDAELAEIVGEAIAFDDPPTLASLLVDLKNDSLLAAFLEADDRPPLAIAPNSSSTSTTTTTTPGRGARRGR